MTDFVNKGFSIAGNGPGQASGWEIATYLQLPGWAKFRTYKGFVLSERFDWFDSYGEQWTGKEPFAVNLNKTFTISAVGVSPSNYFEVAGDVRRLLPPSACFKVQGTVSGQTQLDAYWTVKSMTFTGAATRIYVTEDVLATVAAEITIPPIVYINVDNYGWGANVASGATYPITAPTVGQTLELSIDRGETITIDFAGTETTAQNVVDRMVLQFTFHNVIDKIFPYVENGVPVIRSLTHSTNHHIQVLGGTANGVLLFPTIEEMGFGQFAQLFDIYFTDNTKATAEEIEDIFKKYIPHGYFRAREAHAGGNVLVRSERAGALASCQAWGYNGEILSGATWPIAARTPSNNLLDIVIDTTSLSASLSPGATTAEEIRDDINNAILSAGAIGEASVTGSGNLVIGGASNIQITGGGANIDLAFPTHIVYGNNNVQRTLGFTSNISTGAYDVSTFDSFDNISSVAATFAGGTTVESAFEAFEWNPLYTMDELTTSDATFKSWAEFENGSPIVSVGTSPVNTFAVVGDHARYFFATVKAQVQDSTGNDSEYTVVSSEYATPNTTVTVSESVDSAVADGNIYPMFFGNSADDFDQAWNDTFLSNANDPPFGFWDGVFAGSSVTFPLRVLSNRNEMWIYVASETNLVHIVVDSGTYADAAALIANMNAKFAVASSANIQFSVREESTDQTSAKIAFGWNGLGSTTEEFYFANQHGSADGLDIRKTIGFVGSTIPRVVAPSRYFAKVGGISHDTAPELWQQDTNLFEVDPDSRFSYTIQSTAASETVVVPEGQEFALFNQLSTPDNAANEALVPEGWGGAILDETAFSATLVVAMFDQSITPQEYEDFEEGW